MADGRNNARALRVLEIANDFRTLLTHITSLVNRATAQPPDAASQALMGYRLLTQCRTEAQRLLALQFDPGHLGIVGGNMPQTEVQKTALQRIILDISTRRFQAHQCYLRSAAATRWIANRTQALGGQPPNSRNAAQLQAADQRLREEVTAITDQHVYNNLREADVRKGYWVSEDPTLQQILAWLRAQR